MVSSCQNLLTRPRRDTRPRVSVVYRNQQKSKAESSLLDRLLLCNQLLIFRLLLYKRQKCISLLSHILIGQDITMLCI